MTVTPKRLSTKGLVAILFSLLAVVIVVDMTRVELERTATMPGLPMPVTNNAVVSVTTGGREFLISFAGLGPEKEHDDTHAKTFVFDSNEAEWTEAAPVPGGVGRLAATAVAVGELAYVFGGYSVAADGTEVSTPWVHSFEPLSGEFTELAPMPVPVDDAIAVVYEDRYIYLVSGWHDFGNVNLVQRFDVVENHWDQATPTPGRPVFGHAGGIVGTRSSIVMALRLSRMKTGAGTLSRMPNASQASSMPRSRAELTGGRSRRTRVHRAIAWLQLA